MPNWTETTRDRSQLFQVAAYNNYLKRGNVNPLVEMICNQNCGQRLSMATNYRVEKACEDHWLSESIWLIWCRGSELANDGEQRARKTPPRHLVIETFTNCAMQTDQHLKRIVKTSKTVFYYIHHGRFVRGAREVDSLILPVPHGPFNKNTMSGLQNVADVAWIHHYFAVLTSIGLGARSEALPM